MKLTPNTRLELTRAAWRDRAALADQITHYVFAGDTPLGFTHC
jgi:hypothetical protein